MRVHTKLLLLHLTTPFLLISTIQQDLSLFSYHRKRYLSCVPCISMLNPNPIDLSEVPSYCGTYANLATNGAPRGNSSRPGTDDLDAITRQPRRARQEPIQDPRPVVPAMIFGRSLLSERFDWTPEERRYLQEASLYEERAAERLSVAQEREHLDLAMEEYERRAEAYDRRMAEREAEHRARDERSRNGERERRQLRRQRMRQDLDHRLEHRDMREDPDNDENRHGGEESGRQRRSRDREATLAADS